MSVIGSITDISTKPLQEANKFFDNDWSCSRSIGARLLFIAQLIATTLAIPIILLVGLFAGIVRACEGDGAKGFEETWSALKSHFIIAIPVSFIGIFAPWETTKDVATSQTACWKNSLSENEIEHIQKYSNN